MNQVFVSIVSLGSLGLVFGVILSILDTKLKVKEDPLVQEVLNALPGINCGACGFASCRAFAQGVVKSKNLFGGCLPGGEEVNNKVAQIVSLKKPLGANTLKVVVLCGASRDAKKSSFDYKGPSSCAFVQVSLGSDDCKFGCLGFGDCVGVCPTGALKVEQGLVRVDYKKCIGCGKCVKVCPRNILQLVDTGGSETLWVVSCSNLENGPSTKKVCSKGCISCGICTKIIKESCFYLSGNLSRIDYDKLKTKKKEDLELVKNKCPVKIIDNFDV